MQYMDVNNRPWSKKRLRMPENITFGSGQMTDPRLKSYLRMAGKSANSYMKKTKQGRNESTGLTFWKPSVFF